MLTLLLLLLTKLVRSFRCQLKGWRVTKMILLHLHIELWVWESGRSCDHTGASEPPLWLTADAMVFVRVVSLSLWRNQHPLTRQWGNRIKNKSNAVQWCRPQGHYLLTKPEATGMVIIARWPLENNLKVLWAQVLHTEIYVFCVTADYTSLVISNDLLRCNQSQQSCFAVIGYAGIG